MRFSYRAAAVSAQGRREASAAETANQLYKQDRNPFSQPLLQTAVVTESSSVFVNSNEISNQYITAPTKITIVSCSTAEVFKTTWAIMLDRGLLLVASLLFLISFRIASAANVALLSSSLNISCSSDVSKRRSTISNGCKTRMSVSLVSDLEFQASRFEGDDAFAVEARVTLLLDIFRPSLRAGEFNAKAFNCR